MAITTATRTCEKSQQQKQNLQWMENELFTSIQNNQFMGSFTTTVISSRRRWYATTSYTGRIEMKTWQKYHLVLADYMHTSLILYKSSSDYLQAHIRTIADTGTAEETSRAYQLSQKKKKT